ncbi:hypothetical protein YC2023_085876 [Brassica napus]
MEAITDPSSPVCFPGGGGFFSFAAAGSSSREGEAFSASSSPILAPEGWLFGFEGMSDRLTMKLSIDGDDDKRRKA